MSRHIEYYIAYDIYSDINIYLLGSCTMCVCACMGMCVLLYLLFMVISNRDARSRPISEVYRGKLPTWIDYRNSLEKLHSWQLIKSGLTDTK